MNTGMNVYEAVHKGCTIWKYFFDDNSSECLAIHKKDGQEHIFVIEGNILTTCIPNINELFSPEEIINVIDVTEEYGIKAKPTD